MIKINEKAFSILRNIGYFKEEEIDTLKKLVEMYIEERNLGWWG
jgi:hypothetical protein